MSADNTAPKRVTLYVCPSCGGGINYEPKGSNLSCDCPDGLDEYPACDKPVEYVRADILRELREAVEACAKALGAWEMSSKPFDPTITQGLLRAGDKARRALASLDEQEGQR